MPVGTTCRLRNRDVTPLHRAGDFAKRTPGSYISGDCLPSSQFRDAAGRSVTMSDPEFEERSGGRHKKPSLEAQSVYVAEVFRELFNLLEQYAPVWYTEEHHNRAVAALRVFEEDRQPAGDEA